MLYSNTKIQLFRHHYPQNHHQLKRYIKWLFWKIFSSWRTSLVKRLIRLTKVHAACEASVLSPRDIWEISFGRERITCSWIKLFHTNISCNAMAENWRTAGLIWGTRKTPIHYPPEIDLDQSLPSIFKFHDLPSFSGTFPVHCFTLSPCYLVSSKHQKGRLRKHSNGEDNPESSLLGNLVQRRSLLCPSAIGRENPK